MKALPPVTGLVLAGGLSTRMGQSKALLNYHGETQVAHVCRLLQPHCARVFVACTAEQATTLPAGLPQQHDDTATWGHNGPVTALLTAAVRYPDNALLLAGCDYPFFDDAHVQHLLRHRNEGHQAVAYTNPETGIPEALLGVYEPECFQALREAHAAGRNSLRYFLDTIPALLIPPLLADAIRSVDTPEAREQALNQLKGR